MNTAIPASRPHSAEYFGEERDHWWNSDFLDLLATRLGLGQFGSLLDVGCGVGHWLELLQPRLAADAEATGIDLDPRNVAACRDRLSRLRPGFRPRLDVGDATALPYPDGSFDLVTCQTLLIHLAEPAPALHEMRRVARPGGLVLCVEPNNLASRFPTAALTLAAPAEETLPVLELAWRHTLGRTRRGAGCEMLGDLLPGLMREAGFLDVRVWIADKATPLVPPYTDPAARATLSAWDAWRRDGTGPFDEAEARANVLASGADDETFDRLWQAFLGWSAREREAAASGMLHTAFGGLFYIVAGRVPD